MKTIADLDFEELEKINVVATAFDEAIKAHMCRLKDPNNDPNAMHQTTGYIECRIRNLLRLLELDDLPRY